MISLLLVDDDVDVRATLGIALRRAGFSVEEAASLEESRQRIETRSHDAVVADHRLGDGTGLDLLRWMRGRGSPACFVVISAFGSIPLAVEAMSDGASHFLSKPVEPDALVAVLHEMTGRKSAPIEPGGVPPWLVARSPALLGALEKARQAAQGRSPVLLTGRTGTGKEVVARFIHETGPRRGRPFVAINCAAVSPSLFESEFFGHARGAFTGATGDAAGVFREAHGGTLLLDEVTEIPVALQAKLLRSIETGEIRSVGSASPEVVDVRILSSTNADPLQSVREGRLREDLYYRLSGITISLTPLAARREDVIPLAERFLKEFGALYGKPAARLSPEASRLLETHAWPGNVRELRHSIERAVIGASSPSIAAADLGLEAPDFRDATDDLREVEKHHILKVLAACGNNKTDAARKLGVSRSTLQRKLVEFDLPDPAP